MSQEQTIVIGDVHGCFDELQELLHAAGASRKDRIIGVGDLVAKGPDSRGVLDWAMQTPNLRCVVGNHELRLLCAWREGRRLDSKPYDRETCRQLAPDYERYMRFIAGWPACVAGEEWLVVHAGFDPRGLAAEEQPLERLANLRRLEDTGRPWYEQYLGRRLALFGHWPRRGPMFWGNAIGLDTGCVYGGALTALVLPERRLVSVPARRIYRSKPSWN
jgi:hypothetical protein